MPKMGMSCRPICSAARRKVPSPPTLRATSKSNGATVSTPEMGGQKWGVVVRKAWKSLETKISASKRFSFSNSRCNKGSLSGLYPQPNIPIFIF